MYKVDIPLDAKESAVIERRRNVEMARKSRIFDAKQRQIGVDLTAIDSQVKESNENRQDEKRIHEAYAAQMIRNDKTAQLLDARNHRTRGQMATELNDFRKHHQAKNTRREFDLNDPEVLKNATPMGQNDHGISSLQSFVGEDINNADRQKFQKEQIREWSLALQQERAMAEADQQMQDRMYDLKRIQLDNKACELQYSESMDRQDQVAATKEFNQRLAEEQRINRDAQKNQNLAANVAEIRNQILGDMLTENPAVARSAFGEHRVIPDRWKGMSDSELSKIREAQEAQRLANVQKHENERQNIKEWSLQQTATAKAGILREREDARLRKDLRRRLDTENAELAKQQKHAREQLYNEVYTNVPSNEYYTQFNTTTR